MQRLPLGFYQDVSLHPPLKASVFNKLHQLKGIVDELQKVLDLSQSDRQAWLKDHQQTTLQMFKTFQEYVKLDLNQDDVDKEMLDLLLEYSHALQECSALIRTLFPEVKLEG